MCEKCKELEDQIQQYHELSSDNGSRILELELRNQRLEVIGNIPTVYLVVQRNLNNEFEDEKFGTKILGFHTDMEKAVEDSADFVNSFIVEL